MVEINEVVVLNKSMHACVKQQIRILKTGCSMSYKDFIMFQFVGIGLELIWDAHDKSAC